MFERITSVASGENGAPTGVLRRVGLVILLLPMSTLYPLLYLRHRNEEGETWFDQSPMTAVPGLQADFWFPAVVYGFVLFGGGVVASYAVPTMAAPADGVLLGLGLVTGAGVVTYLYHAKGIDRAFLRRTGYATAIGVAYVLVAAGLLQAVFRYRAASLVGSPEYLLRAGLPFLLGSMAGNGYAVKCEEYKQESKREGEKDESQSHIRTRASKGTEVSDSKGQSILESFQEQSWMTPDDLATGSEIDRTRTIEPFRDIVRGLWVEETLYEKTVPKPAYRDEKRKHRTDYNSRSEVAPSGFESKTYTFFVPNSRAEQTCGDCRGSGTLTCGSCSGSGRVTCRSCNGNGKAACGRCSGEGRIIETRKCSVCGGSGESKQGVWCSSCGGDGYTEESHNCPDCSYGEVDCGTCAGRGKVTCDSCSGSGKHTCGQCQGSGKLVQYEYVERSYSPDSDVSYRTKSVPKQLLTDADGKRVSRDTDRNPSKSGLYRKQEETRKIPVTVAQYEYLGDKWEVFEVENTIEALDFPRDYQKQFRIVQVGVFLLAPAYVAAVVAL
ncbi:hypothetical protein [Halosimplex halophilum]|uniref:hypothetical protein n=1 Tax=Halosimplex halophilum TaxID=2559572 RepID=UPI00107F293C|nr:hypothetical protein [Halosimplex halophilum]